SIPLSLQLSLLAETPLIISTIIPEIIPSEAILGINRACMQLWRKRCGRGNRVFTRGIPMRVFNAMAAAILLTTAALLAFGQGVRPDRTQDRTKPKAGPNAAMQFAEQAPRQMDTNRDGKVSREEFTAHPDYFDRFDANQDGFIVLREVRPGM